MVERVEDYTNRAEPERHTYRPEPLREIEPLAVEERVLERIADIESLPRLPMQLIKKYADLAVRHATLKQVEDGEWFATIPRFPGVWAKEATEERVREVLREVVEEWTVLKIQHKHGDLPELDEINLNVL